MAISQMQIERIQEIQGKAAEVWKNKNKPAELWSPTIKSLANRDRQYKRKKTVIQFIPNVQLIMEEREGVDFLRAEDDEKSPSTLLELATGVKISEQFDKYTCMSACMGSIAARDEANAAAIGAYFYVLVKNDDLADESLHPKFDAISNEMMNAYLNEFYDEFTVEFLYLIFSSSMKNINSNVSLSPFTSLLISCMCFWIDKSKYDGLIT